MKAGFLWVFAALAAAPAYAQAPDTPPDPAQLLQNICIRHNASAAPIETALAAAGWQRLPDEEADPLFSGVLPHARAAYAVPGSDQVFLLIGYTGQVTSEMRRRQEAGQVAISEAVSADRPLSYPILDIPPDVIGWKGCDVFLKGNTISAEDMNELAVAGRPVGLPYGWSAEYLAQAEQRFDRAHYVWHDNISFTINFVRDVDPGTGFLTTRISFSKLITLDDPATDYTLKN